MEHFVVECRRKVQLETLRGDLHVYLKILQSAMIELINKDYADFVNLSTNLVASSYIADCTVVNAKSIRSDVRRYLFQLVHLCTNQ